MDTSTLLGLFSIKLVELCTVILSLPQKASENHLMKCVVQKKHEKQSSKCPFRPFAFQKCENHRDSRRSEDEPWSPGLQQFTISYLATLKDEQRHWCRFFIYSVYLCHKHLGKENIETHKLFLHVQPPCPRRRSASNATVAKTNSAPHPRRLRDLLWISSEIIGNCWYIYIYIVQRFIFIYIYF